MESEGYIPVNEAEDRGYATWNTGDHLCVDVPDGLSTISCKLSNGEKVTFSFLPYQEGGVPRCIDISHVTGEKVATPEGHPLTQTNAIVFDSPYKDDGETPNPCNRRVLNDSGHTPVLICVLLDKE